MKTKSLQEWVIFVRMDVFFRNSKHYALRAISYRVAGNA